MNILYTTLPLELVWAGFDPEEEIETFEVPIQGGTLVVEPLEKNQARILRVISSDPGLFLKPHLQPGRIIGFPPSLDL